MPAIATVTPPAVEPVSSTDLATFLRIDSGDAVSLADATSMAVAARTWIETYLRRRLITQTVALYLDHFPWGSGGGAFQQGYPANRYNTELYPGADLWIVLPGGNIQEIESFTFSSPGGTVTTLTEGQANDYIADLESVPARLTPCFGEPWLPAGQYNVNSVRIEYKCGYGDTGASVPQPIILAIKLLTSWYYENRNPATTDVPMAVRALLTPFRNIYF